MSVAIVKPDGAALVFDATPRISYSRSIRTTDHPIEDGSTITDHAQAEPLLISITGIVTETPLAASPSTTGGVARVLAAIDFLKGCEGVLVSIIDPRLGTTADCLLTRYPYTVDGVRRVEFGIESKQVEIATATTVFIPGVVGGTGAAGPTYPSTPAILASLVNAQAVAESIRINAQITEGTDAGVQSTSDSSADPAAESGDQSTLLTLAEATGAA